MKQYLIRLLRKLLAWLEPEVHAVADSSAPAKLSPAYQRIKQLVVEAEKLIAVSGEYKRHVVYAQLLKEFPDVAKRVLALEIEIALNE